MTGDPLKLDWSSLPQGLRFVAGPAERYGWRQFDEQIEEFEQSASESERDELKTLARRLWNERNAADGHALVAWVTRQDIKTNEAAARVEFLLKLMTELGYS